MLSSNVVFKLSSKIQNKKLKSGANTGKKTESVLSFLFVDLFFKRRFIKDRKLLVSYIFNTFNKVHFMDKMKQYALKKESANLTPLLSIGKNGLSDSVIDELKKQLKAKKLVKVRIHKNSGESDDMSAIAAELSEKCGAFLIDVRGRTVTLYK